MGLYDLFARGVTGIAVLCAADLFAIADILSSDAPVWARIIGGYFCGLVLEELSLIREKGFCRVKHKNGKKKTDSAKESKNAFVLSTRNIISRIVKER